MCHPCRRSEVLPMSPVAHAKARRVRGCGGDVCSNGGGSHYLTRSLRSRPLPQGERGASRQSRKPFRCRSAFPAQAGTIHNVKQRFRSSRSTFLLFSSFPSCAFLQRRIGSGTPADAVATSAPCGAALLQREQHAYRRPTAALTAATKRHRSAPAHALPGTEPRRDGCYPPPAVSSAAPPCFKDHLRCRRKGADRS
jgi:hypothetical protein